MADGKLTLKIDAKANETGLAIETCMQRVMKAQGFEHQVDALQYMIEHLVAASAAIGIPSALIIASCMDAIQAGTSQETRDKMDKLIGEFQKGH